MNSLLHPLRYGGEVFNAILVGYPHPSHVVELRLFLRQRPHNVTQLREMDALLQLHPSKRKYLSHTELSAVFGHDPEDVKQLRAYFEGQGLNVKLDHALMRSIRVKGAVQQVEKAFGARMEKLTVDYLHHFVGYRGPLCLPENLHPMVMHVSGLNPCPVKEERVRHRVSAVEGALPGGYSLAAIQKAYQFPGTDNKDSPCIGVIELGGRFQQGDLNQFFKLNHLQMPTVTVVGTPLGVDPHLDDVEVTVDIEVAGALIAQPQKTGRKPEIVVYYGSSVADAVALAISDEVNRPSVLSISWASPETNYNSEELTELNRLFYIAAQLGITVLAASGDSGAYNGRPKPVVSFPAVHPLVIGVGGTLLNLNAAGQIENEVVWNENGGESASGGGFSDLYPLPEYQDAAVSAYLSRPGTARGVPDVAANAANASGYQVLFQGKVFAVGGTSLSTPFWAGLIAQLNGRLGYRLGYCHPLLYQAKATFRPIVEGNNQYYTAAAGWNACTGLGSPNGEALLKALKAK